MNSLLHYIFYLNVDFIKFRNNAELVIASKPHRVIDARFIFSIFIFTAAMVLKANTDSVWAALLLGYCALHLFFNVWRISGNALVVFDKNDSSVYRIYKHLGYLQKIYSTPLSSVIQAKVNTSKDYAFLVLVLDNLTEIVISKQKINNQTSLEAIANEISTFISG